MGEQITFLIGIFTPRIEGFRAPEGNLHLLDWGRLAGHGLLPAIKDVVRNVFLHIGHWLFLWAAVSYRTLHGVRSRRPRREHPTSIPEEGGLE